MSGLIVSFAWWKTEPLGLRRRDHGLPPQIERVALRKLTQLHRIRKKDLPPDSVHVERTGGGTAGIGSRESVLECGAEHRFPSCPRRGMDASAEQTRACGRIWDW